MRADFDHLRRWCADEWEWVTVGVVLTDADGEEVASDYVEGIESDCDDYIADMVREMAETIRDRCGDRIERAFSCEDDTHA